MLLDHSFLDGSLLTFLIQLCSLFFFFLCFQTLQNYNSLRYDSHITQYPKLFHSRNTRRTFNPTYCWKWQSLVYLQLLSSLHFLSSYCFWIISQIQTYLDWFSKFLFFTTFFHLFAFLSLLFGYSILFPLFFFCSHIVIPRTFPRFLSVPFYIISIL